MTLDISKDLIRVGNIVFVPVLHGRFEFGAVVLRLIHELKPDAVALEFPETLRRVFERGISRLPFLSVILYPEDNGRYVYLPLEPQDAMVAAGWLAISSGIPVHYIDRDTDGYPFRREAFPDSYSVRRLGLAAYVNAYTAQFSEAPVDPQDQMRDMTMAYHLQELGRNNQLVLCVLGLAHFPNVRRLLSQKLVRPLGRVHRNDVTLANLAKESSREILSDMPYLATALCRASGMAGADIPASTNELDRLSLHQSLLSEAKARHKKNSKEEVSRSALAVLNKFARNYALVQSYLTPDLFQLLVAARGAVDDNFAYEMWDIGTEYPWQDEDSDLPTLRLTGEDLYLDSKKIRFYRRFRQTRRRLVPVPVKKRKKEDKPGEWKEKWEGQNICSHPPEDIVIEGFGHYLRKKAVQILSAENRRVQPFEASLLDGIDLRETIRNWHEHRLYVVENRPVQGKVGSIVIIFDEDNPDENLEEQFPWKVTWLGEHDQESDMAFYSTPAGEHVIGPGISRCEYGGLMLTYPPLRVYDIWKDNFFDGARSKAERLLLAGIDYSEEKLIAYIAAKPPASRIKTLANMYGKKVVYLPIGQFSPVTLKKIRVFHVLDGHQVRRWAGDYIY